MVPAKQIQPMRDTRGDVHLVSPTSLQLYRDLTGLPGDYTPSTRRVHRTKQPATTPCINPNHSHRNTPTHCACGQQIYQLTHLKRVRDDLCERCRINLGLPPPHLPY